LRIVINKKKYQVVLGFFFALWYFVLIGFFPLFVVDFCVVLLVVFLVVLPVSILFIMNDGFFIIIGLFGICNVFAVLFDTFVALFNDIFSVVLLTTDFAFILPNVCLFNVSCAINLSVLLIIGLFVALISGSDLFIVTGFPIIISNDGFSVVLLIVVLLIVVLLIVVPLIVVLLIVVLLLTVVLNTAGLFVTSNPEASIELLVVDFTALDSILPISCTFSTIFAVE